MARSNAQMTGVEQPLAIQPQSPGLSDRIWWGAGSRATAVWTAQQGMNLMSSTLLTEDTGVPFDELRAEQIAMFRAAWAEAGWEREPRISVSRAVLPIVNDEDRANFGLRAQADSKDQVGYLDASTLARFGRSLQSHQTKANPSPTARLTTAEIQTPRQPPCYSDTNQRVRPYGSRHTWAGWRPLGWPPGFHTDMADSSTQPILVLLLLRRRCRRADVKLLIDRQRY